MTLLGILTFPAIQTALTTLVIYYTLKSSLLRPAVVPLIALTTYKTWNALDLFDNTQPLNPLMAAIVFGFGLHHFHLLCTGAIDIEDVEEDIRQKSSSSTDWKKGSKIPKRASLHRTLYIATSIRGIGTSYEVKNIKHGSETNASRVSFLTRNLLIIVAKYLFLDLILYKPLTPEDANRYFPEGSEYLFFRPDNLAPVTALDVAKNLAIALFTCGPTGTWYIDLQYRVVSVISVALGLSTPEEWPVLFGSITETYTVRGFWGKYWHQLFRWPMTGISTFVTRSILRLPRPSLVERYLKIALVFVVSATLHIAMDGCAGFWPPKSGAFRCFLIQPIGIMVEDGVQEIYRRVRGSSVLTARERIWTRMVGYIWVGGFMACVIPLYTFPLLRYQNSANNGVPFSVVRLVEAWVRAE
ncbi:membrane bound O-acyl transferase family-domain-containing protein [Aspergillus pseudoustus]|uniref:Membrane bound O-acyl transferase family-domain-containing protein n=1 Tax=Aspergillus pseudoustus TaxID=1810923 RepID=A0ABR4JK64_9EURO